MMLDVGPIAERVAEVRARIGQAAAAAGRAPEDVLLVAVTKTHPVELAEAAVRLGLLDLAENRVDALASKRDRVEARWHLVGQLQRNKVRDAIGRAHLIHSVDRRALVDAIGRQATARALVQDVLIQVNVGDDPAKGGCDLTAAEELVSYAVATPGVRVRGLMTVPPLPPEGVEPGTAAGPHFSQLRALRDRLRETHPEVQELSMGMSDDLESAVREGATMVRIGSALFGPREEIA